MNRRTSIVLAVIVVILIAVFAITRWQRHLATQKLLSELPGDDYSKIEDAMIQLKERGHAIVPALLGLLESPSAAGRWRAASLLGDVGTRRAWDSLVTALEDPSPDVRAAAATALGKLRVKKAVSALVAHLRNDKEDMGVRIAAAQALGLIGDPTAADALADELKDKLEAFQAVAASAQKAEDDAIAALEKAKADLAAATPDKRAEAQKAVEDAQKAMDDAKKANEKAQANLRAAAARMPAGPQPRTAPGEKPAEPTDTRWELRQVCATSLGMLSDEKCIAPLVDSIGEDNEPHVEVRLAAVKALGDLAQRIHREASVSALLNGLLKALDDKTADIRAAALWALQFVIPPKYMEARVEEALKKGLNDEAYWAREAARSSMKALNIPVPSV